MKMEFRVVLPSGEIRWLEALGKVEFATDGAPLHMFGINHDITARKRDELAGRESDAALHQSQVRLRHAADAGRLTYAEFNLRAGFANAAENYARVMGYKPSSVRHPVELGDALAALMEHVPIGDRARLVDAFAELRSGRKKAKAEYRVLGDDGVERWIESAATAEFDRDGRPDQIFVTSLDVTEQVEGRMALEAAHDKADEILSSIADGFYALDSEWRFVYFNDRAERHLHKSS